jgi:hypothetical protein
MEDKEKFNMEDKLVPRVTASSKLLDHSLASDVSEPVLEEDSVLFLSSLSPVCLSPLSPVGLSPTTWRPSPYLRLSPLESVLYNTDSHSTCASCVRGSNKCASGHSTGVD